MIKVSEIKFRYKSFRKIISDFCINCLNSVLEDTGCNPEDLPEAMNDREKWRERVRDIRAGGAT